MDSRDFAWQPRRVTALREPVTVLAPPPARNAPGGVPRGRSREVRLRSLLLPRLFYLSLAHLERLELLHGARVRRVQRDRREVGVDRQLLVAVLHVRAAQVAERVAGLRVDRKSTRLNSSHVSES